MTLKQFFAVCVAAVAVPLAVSAIPADPKPKQVLQPDGSTLTIRIVGDERSHMVLTADGIPLFRNSQTGAFEYAKLSGDTLAGCGIVAADAARRSAAAQAYVAGLDINAVKQAVAKQPQGRLMLPPTQRIRINEFPVIGSPKCLVILIEFPNCKFKTDNPRQFSTT